MQHAQLTDCDLVFGDFTWQDYDFTCEAKKFGGIESVGLLYRVTGAGYGVPTRTAQTTAAQLT